jgi:hypothetical protein
MELLKPLTVRLKDPAKLPDTSRNSMAHHIKSPQNPSGRFLLDKSYEVFGITEVQARAWSFLLIAETNELVWIDMEYCLYAPETTPVVEVAQAVKTESVAVESKIGRPKKNHPESLGHA